MTKFISWVSAIAVLVCVISCREAEELNPAPEANNTAFIKTYNNTIHHIVQDTLSENSTTSLNQTKTDPPKKDEIKW